MFNNIIALKYILNNITFIIFMKNNKIYFLLNNKLINYLVVYFKFSTIFYNSGLIFITGADLLNNTLLINYCFNINLENRLSIISILNKNQTASISDLYQNAI